MFANRRLHVRKQDEFRKTPDECRKTPDEFMKAHIQTKRAVRIVAKFCASMSLVLHTFFDAVGDMLIGKSDTNYPSVTPRRIVLTSLEPNCNLTYLT